VIIEDTFVSGLKLLKIDKFQDNRGIFTKSFSSDIFEMNGIDLTFKESFYTLSHKDVIRGMHFQKPPYSCSKLVSVSSGEVLDVVIDLRKKSTTYGKYFSVTLSDINSYALLIPAGFAHGFKSMKENTIVNYIQTACYSKPHDSGIHYDSFGFDWNCENKIISDRDKSFVSFAKFISPF
jgi:dTDP-4-dehydrorhamnose 3,5-epimerase